MTLKFKKLHPDAKLPTRGSQHAAGYDLYAAEEATLYPGCRAAITTGLSVAIPEGYYGRIAPRSGSAVKGGLDCLAGVADCDFRGELKVVLINLDFVCNIPSGTILAGKPYLIYSGDRIAQLIVQPIANPEPEWADELPDSVRGEKGFGSSGI